MAKEKKLTKTEWEQERFEEIGAEIKERNVRTARPFRIMCPECLAESRARHAAGDRRRGEGCSATLWISFTDDWVDHLAVDCDQTADHVVTLEGAWTNPIIQGVLKRYRVTEAYCKAHYIGDRKGRSRG